MMREDDSTEKGKETTDGLVDGGRRKAVKTLVGGVTAFAAMQALPTSWERPIIESIFLPAHAATSGTSLHDPCQVTWVEGYQDSNTVVIRVSGFVTPPTSGLAATIVATGNPDTTATATVNTTTADDGTFSATLTLTTASGLTSVAVRTTVAGADGSAECSVNIPVRNQENTAPTGPALPDVTRGDNGGGPIIDPIITSTGVNDVDGDTLTYSATGLPVGFSIDPNTGEISGVIDVLGPTNFTVTVNVSDGRGGLLSRTFTLTITDQG